MTPVTFDPDGGDLGRATMVITALEMQLIVPHVANILSEVAAMKLTPLYLKYAFEVRRDEREAAMFVIYSSMNSLPPNVSWYESNGEKLFEMRGVLGGVVAAYVCYLVAK